MSEEGELSSPIVRASTEGLAITEPAGRRTEEKFVEISES
jgi:hypothetical protein